MGDEEEMEEYGDRVLSHKSVGCDTKFDIKLTVDGFFQENTKVNIQD